MKVSWQQTLAREKKAASSLRLRLLFNHLIYWFETILDTCNKPALERKTYSEQNKIYSHSLPQYASTIINYHTRFSTDESTCKMFELKYAGGSIDK